jgi:hypothetical protein
MRGDHGQHFQSANPTSHRPAQNIGDPPVRLQSSVHSIAESGGKSTVRKCVTHVRAVLGVQVEDAHLVRNVAKVSTMDQQTR